MTRPAFSLRVNNDLSPGQLIDMAVAAEHAGIDQLWVSNDLMMRSAPVLLGAIAMRTSTIKLGIGIMNPYSVHPSELAMTAATLQEVTGGRFLLGLGAGAGDFLSWIGIDQKLPLTKTREALRAIRALLAGAKPSQTEGAGTAWTDDAYLRLEPTSVPIYIGAMSPKMLAFAGAEADGVLALLFPPEHYTTASGLVAEGAEAAGRALSDLDMPACVWLALDEDQGQADRALALKLAYYGGAFSPYLLSRAGLAPEDFAESEAALRAGDEAAAVAAITPAMLRLGISGNPQSVVDRCDEVMALGASHLSFGPPLGPDPVAAIELLGREVLPQLRQRHAARAGSSHPT
ncbi:LLM class flavin-dependent oxidoreductase [Agromyces sp. Leaf222]|uniref:LLM class flavin-dependent oxidoreductase n=1 Tax=Agromyces sp. Leaf222 TaxID=1735688 RepID=UPI000700CCD6|nr:LLM class flavin-dependent oxidoreductase [Agromyces sp. Leaf222]KQM83054.1 5,10-methylene tetrahydromethanopterin reductase [Agromyces sp. Leaf222]